MRGARNVGGSQPAAGRADVKTPPAGAASKRGRLAGAAWGEAAGELLDRRARGSGDLRLRWSIGPTQSSPACNHSIAVLEFDTAAIQFAARRHPAAENWR
jgi:hypothetical protein